MNNETKNPLKDQSTVEILSQKISYLRDKKILSTSDQHYAGFMKIAYSAKKKVSLHVLRSPLFNILVVNFHDEGGEYNPQMRFYKFDLKNTYKVVDIQEFLHLEIKNKLKEYLNSCVQKNFQFGSNKSSQKICDVFFSFPKKGNLSSVYLRVPQEYDSARKYIEIEWSYDHFELKKVESVYNVITLDQNLRDELF